MFTVEDIDKTLLGHVMSGLEILMSLVEPIIE